MIIKYFSWVKDIVGKSEEIISISPDIDTPEKLIDFLITSIAFVILAFLNYRKVGKTLETIYLSILAVFFVVCFIILNFY